MQCIFHSIVIYETLILSDHWALSNFPQHTGKSNADKFVIHLVARSLSNVTLEYLCALSCRVAILHTVWPINSNPGLVYSAVSALSDSRPFTICIAPLTNCSREILHSHLGSITRFFESTDRQTGNRFRVQWFRWNRRRRQNASWDWRRCLEGCASSIAYVEIRR